jgi:acyl carrier protein
MEESTMNDSLEHVVRRVLASHLGKTIESVQPAHRLRRDLELLPFDLVLVALRLEEIAEARIPSELLMSVHTVAELTQALGSCARGRGVDVLEHRDSK